MILVKEDKGEMSAWNWVNQRRSSPHWMSMSMRVMVATRSRSFVDCNEHQSTPYSGREAFIDKA